MSEARAPSDETHNVDPAEVAKFDALASRWWDPQGDSGPLHAINPLRLDWIRQHVDLKGSRVLDVGCGGGILAESMAAVGATVTGIDAAEKPLAVARLHALQAGVHIDYRQSTAESLALQHADSFDVVTCMELLEHVPDPGAIIDACATLVKPGGTVVFSTINRNPKAFLFAIVGAERVLKMLPAGTHEYRKFIRPSELEEGARQTGLELTASIGMQYNPITRQYTLQHDLAVNYLLCFQRRATI